ncbi:MAG: YggS family pyridoxal phosphate-dependent enzyme [Actinomycetales bacterium]
MTPAEGGAGRREQIVAGLARTRERIATAAAAAGRDPAGVRLVVVTKDHPAQDLRHLADLDVLDVGESRQQQLRDKHAELGDLATRLRWHAVGRLQRNKARAVARLADVVHSVDDVRLLPLLAAGAQEAGRQLDCLVQVSLDAAPGRGGVPADEVAALAAAVAAADGLALRGVMAVAPLGADPDEAFARLAGVSVGLRGDHPRATWVSAGMSGDLEAAVAHGATHVRVGTAILGYRQVTR